MDRCRTCRHWQNVEDKDSNACRMSRPHHWSQGKAVNGCMATWSDQGEPVDADAMAVAIDDPGDDGEYQAILFTTEDFGCVMHEARR